VETEAHNALKQAGFFFVQEEPRLAELRNYRPDLLAWADNSEGKLVPWAVTEVRRRLNGPLELVLPQLARYRDLIGTVDHYLLHGGLWYLADEGLRSFRLVEGPKPPPFGGTGELADVGLVTSLLAREAWGGDTAAHAHGRSATEPVGGVLRSAVRRGIAFTSDSYAPVARHTLFHASRRLVNMAVERDRHGVTLTLKPALAAAMAALAGRKLRGSVVDPFAGVGSVLWAAADEAEWRGERVSLRGVGYVDSAQELATAIALSSPVPASFEVGDRLFAPAPPADIVLSVPPSGVRLQRGDAPYELLNGERVRDGDVAAVDVALRSLKPGGRAVLLVSNGFTFRGTGDSYRRFLAERYRVAALIGIEGALKPLSGLSTVLMVIDHAAPGETFVAQLAGDWELQLATKGTALEAALKHIDGVSAEA
jgi:hypothetical protein